MKVERAGGLGAQLRSDIRMAADGSVGAAVLAMRTIGVSVDTSTLEAIAASIKEKATVRA